MIRRLFSSFSRQKLVLWAGFILLLGLWLCFPSSAMAAYRQGIYVEPVYPQSREIIGRHSRVLVYEKSKENFLFLPSGWDQLPLKFTYSHKETLYLDGTPIISGDVTTIFQPGLTLAFANEKGIVQLRLQVMQGTGIPSVFIQTESGTMRGLDRSKANIETGDLLVYGADGSLENDVMISEIRGRGNSTYNVGFPKRGYQFRLESSDDLCGMGRAKAYNLMADHIDISLLRNRISMDLAKQVGIPYAMDSQSVNVYFNNCYNGVYLLTEKPGVNENRLDIYDLEKATLRANGGDLGDITHSLTYGDNREWYASYNIEANPPNITGGYILELEAPIRFTKPENGFRTSNGACFVIKEPTQASLEQVQFICSILERYHRAILSSTGIDPKSGMHFSELVDTDSMALVLILQDFCKNYDHEQCSLFFFKDVDEVSPKVFAGPVWDFDRAYGSVQTGRWLNSPNNMLYQGNKLQHYIYGNAYNKQPVFRARVEELYAERYLPALALLLDEREREPGDALRSLAAYRAEIEPSARMNFTFWNSFGVRQIVKYSGQTFDASYDYLLRFIQNRRTALTANWVRE